MPALKNVLRPEVASWKRPKVVSERRPWELDDLPEPEQLAREAIAELQEAVKCLKASLELLPSPKPKR